MYFLSYCPCCEIEWTNFDELEHHCLNSYIPSRKLRCRHQGCLEKYDTMPDYLKHVKEAHFLKKTKIFTVESPARVELDHEDRLGEEPTVGHPVNDVGHTSVPLYSSHFYEDHRSQLQLPSVYTATIVQRPLSPDTIHKNECLGCIGIFCCIVILAIICSAWFAFWYYADEAAAGTFSYTKRMLNNSYYKQ